MVTSCISFALFKLEINYACIFYHLDSDWAHAFSSPAQVSSVGRGPWKAGNDQNFFFFYPCHFSVACRGCSRSITLLFPKEWLFCFFFKWLWYSGQSVGKRRALISSELAASTGLCFPARPKSLNSLGTLNGNILMRPVLRMVRMPVVTCRRWGGDVCEMNSHQHFFRREPSSSQAPCGCPIQQFLLNKFRDLKEI